MIDTNLSGRTVDRARSRRAARPHGAMAKTVLAQLATREPRGVGEMVERMREDYMVVLSESVITSNIRATPVTIAVEGQEDSRSQALVESLQQLWERSLTDMLDSFAYGRVAFEKVFEYQAKTGINTIRKLEALPFKQTEMQLDEGEYQGVKLTAKSQTLELSADETWWLALDPTALEPHGKSRFSGAPYKVWAARDHLFKLRKKFAERFVIRGGTARVPNGEQLEDGEIRDPYEVMENALEALYSGGSLMLPGEKDRNGEYLWQFNEAEVRGLDPSPIDALIDGTDVEQLRSFGIPEKTVIEGEAVGSFAMVSQQMLLLLAAVEDVLAQLVDSFQRYVVDKLVAMNWFRDAPQITITFPSLTKRPDSAVSRLVEALLANPMFLEAMLAGGVDVREVLEQVGLPVTDELEQRFAEALTRVQQAPAQQSPLGLSRRLAIQPGPPPAASALPSVDQFADQAMEESARLMAALQAALEAMHAGEPGADDQVRSLVAEIKQLEADTRIAARLIGLVSPWQPQLQPKSADGEGQEPLRLSIEALEPDGRPEPRTDRFRYPWTTNAVDWLLDKQVVTIDELRAMARQDRASVFSASGVDDLRLLNDLKLEVAVSLESGESLDTFKDRIAGRIGTAEAEVNTIYRTNTKQAYQAGMEHTLEKPGVSELFPYVQYVATSDTRTRPHHDVLDGLVVRRGTREHRLLQAALADYNCRCTVIPMTEEDAAFHTIATWDTIPQIAKDHYSVLPLPLAA